MVDGFDGVKSFILTSSFMTSTKQYKQPNFSTQTESPMQYACMHAISDVGSVLPYTFIQYSWNPKPLHAYEGYI